LPKESKKEGFHSAAGLIRYFDSEDEKALKINPWLVFIMGVILIAGVALAEFYYGG
jgi:preprotein translocase subunit Sec61beta